MTITRTRTKKSKTLKTRTKTTMKLSKPNHQVQQHGIHIELTNIRKSDKPELIEITSKPHIMKFIGPGKTWTPSDVDKYIDYTIQDAQIPTPKRTWFSYAIRDSDTNKLIGVIEFKCISIYKLLPANIRQKYWNDVALTIYINDTYQGKGIARMAIEQLKQKISKFKPRAKLLISVVKSTNPIMQQAMTKLGFSNIGPIPSHGPNGLLMYTTNIKSSPNKK